MHLKNITTSFLLFLFSTICFASDNYCENLGFELGNFTNWVGQTWLYSTDVSSINTSKSTGIVNRRQTIISDQSAYDANTGNALKKIPSGYTYSARLGDATTNSDSNPRCWQQSLKYTLTVDSTNALLIVKFACVLEYANDHTASMEPRFKMTLYNQSGSKINDCANYDVYASGSMSGFQTYTPTTANSQGKGEINPVKWRDWTTVGANLLPYIGQTITLEFVATDCTGRFHYGYAYFVAKCQPMTINLKYCANDANAILTAPEGFSSYSWKNSSGSIIGSAQILNLSNPVEGETLTCYMTSATGCTTSLQAKVLKYIPKAEFSSAMIDCNSNKVQFTNNSTTTHGSLNYLWDFGDGNTSTEQNPLYTFKTSGLHTVKLKITNLPMMCQDSITKTVESFSPPLVGLSGNSTYCVGQSTTLKAYGAYNYTWSNNQSIDSININSPTNIWMVGHSSTGCYSDTIYRHIAQEPDWIFTVNGDTTFCQGESSILSGEGGATYIWNNGATSNNITVTESGEYTVTGYNARGCQKSHTFHVIVYPLPKAEFTLSKTEVSKKYNELSGNASTESNTNYQWDLGDGYSYNGSSFTHKYACSSVYFYNISLLATNNYGCTRSASLSVDVVPFIPNVFTPNSDGTNDLFLKDFDIHIYDRNGILLYEGTEGWDGKYNGKQVNPDTYFYLVAYENKDKGTQYKKGFITLQR